MSGIRIVFVVPAFPKLSETFIVSKFLGLLKRGWDVHIVCGQSAEEEWHRFSELDTKAIHRRVHVTLPTHPRWMVPLLFPVTLARALMANPKGTLRYLRQGWRRWGIGVLRHFYLDAEIVRLRPQILHFEFGALAVGRMHLKDLLGCKVVVSFRGYDLNYVGLEEPLYYHEVWDKADALHLLGEDLWRRAQRRGCPQDKPHALIPPAIDTGFWNPGRRRRHVDKTGSAERPLRILSVGRLEWKKGYEYALQAVALLMAQGLQCEYHIVGDGSFLEPVAFARHQLGLEKEVKLLGALPREEVYEQMLWADVFLHAAVSEGFCNAVMEAQAMMLPVVSSDADGLPENVADGVTGFVVPRRNPRALAERLALLAADPDLRQRMGEAGRRRVLTHFRLEDQIEAFDRLYHMVLHGEPL